MRRVDTRVMCDMDGGLARGGGKPPLAAFDQANSE